MAIYAVAIWGDKRDIAGHGFDDGSVAEDNIAVWDGVSWSRAGEGTDDMISALVSYHGGIIAGGQFDLAGEVETRGIAAWCQH